ncbi:MAG: deoxyribonuclease IV [Gemmatimonadetes bacterium]|nr:deoxyribonuclease IV [Gemmatimonadota bacterium]
MKPKRKSSAQIAARPKQPFGAHMSVAGGFENAFAAGLRAGCDCLQIFVKNQRQWNAKPLTDEVVHSYRTAARETGLSPVVAHASYLVNLASPDAALRRRSVAALADEVIRCHRLGVAYLVLHPGAHMGEGVDSGIRRIIRCLDDLHKAVADASTSVLLETTAGQGSSIGHEVEHLARIIDGVRQPERLGVCVDTCHVFAAGYDISTADGYERLATELVDLITLDHVKCFHVNDSKGACGSRVDRHEHIGKGKIGSAGFRNLLNDPRFASVPKILETPKGVDGRGTDLDRVNLGRLRRLIE